MVGRLKYIHKSEKCFVISEDVEIIIRLINTPLVFKLKQIKRPMMLIINDVSFLLMCFIYTPELCKSPV